MQTFSPSSAGKSNNRLLRNSMVFSKQKLHELIQLPETFESLNKPKTGH